MINEYAQVTLFLGAALSTGVASISAGFGEGQTAAVTTKAIMRQPGARDIMLRSMLISQAVTESGAIFALVISLLLLFGGFLDESVDLAKAFSFLAAGMAMGFGSMGPNFGSGFAGSNACDAIGRTPSQHIPVTTNMLIGQALSQTSAIFALVVSLLLLYTVPNMAENQEILHQVVKACAYFGAAFAIGFGTLGPGSGIGFIAGKTCQMIARYKEKQSYFMRTMFLGAAVSESTAIYSLVVAFLLIFM
ncbi:MAG: ATP synthase F0 subunit C [Candidatus Cloacimonetes bacterium]|jgi:F0F1-type ATP synthase membrane subunit c/vacuolar-type H+-ATPase subunit K|nr:ATP synthase F0 subunit C [Candidatus Cloacimonadota bacterium]MDD4155131.1 ATP synthase F0 subunit C [Candidatus Cloacimonadota bacterium]